MIMPSVTVRDACPADAAEIHRVELASFSDPWSLEAFHHLIEAKERGFVRVVVACADERIVGFSVAERADPEIHVTNIAVDQSFRRMGIGLRLMEAVMSWAEVEGFQEMWLEVRESNLAARELYRALGFVEVLRRRRYYRLPAEDALVLGLHLQNGQALPRPRVAVSLDPYS